MSAQWLYTHGPVRVDFVRVAQAMESDGNRIMLEALTGVGGWSGFESTRLDILVDAGLRTRLVPLEVDIGKTVIEDDRLTSSVQWHGFDAKDPALPFKGAIDVYPVDGATVEVALYGRYESPAGQEDAAEATALTHQAARRIRDGFAQVLVRRLGETPGDRAETAARLRVGDVMTRDVITVHEDVSLREAIRLLLHYGVGGLPVTDDADLLLGVLTETDLLPREAAQRVRKGPAAREEARRRLAESVGEACSRPALTTHPDTYLQEAARQMLDSDVSRLVVADGRSVVGIITRRDVLKALVRSTAALQAAIEDLVASHGSPGLQVQMASSGQLFVTGTCSSQETLDAFVAAVARVDGVTSVHQHVDLSVAG